MNSSPQPKRIAGIAALVFGLFALGLAIIPRAVFGVPPPWPQFSHEGPREVTEGGTTLEWKSLKVTVGGKTKQETPQPPSMSAKAFAVATAVVAIVGIGFGIVAFQSKAGSGPAFSGIGLCLAALLWHYILLGVGVGICILIILLLARSVAGA